VEAVDGRSDVSGLGAVGLFALTGGHRSRGAGRVLAAHLTQTPPRADDRRLGVPGEQTPESSRVVSRVRNVWSRVARR
jgi:hypothetical protein